MRFREIHLHKLQGEIVTYEQARAFLARTDPDRSRLASVLGIKLTPLPFSCPPQQKPWLDQLRDDYQEQKYGDAYRRQVADRERRAEYARDMDRRIGQQLDDLEAATWPTPTPV